MKEKMLIVLIFISGMLITSCDKAANTANTSGNRQTNVDATKEVTEKVTFLVPKSSFYSAVGKDKIINSEGENNLKTVAENLKAKLNKADYSKTRFHKINNGFAVVSGVQRFNGENWESLGEGIREVSAENFDEYKKYLMNGKKIFYRFVVFTVTTDENPEDEEKTPTFEQALTWAIRKTETSSTKTNSPNMKDVFDQPFTDQHECIAHIYVFEKNYTIDEAKFVSADSDKAKNYLNKIMN